MTPEDKLRFHSKCHIQPNGCILWTGKPDKRGFGRILIDGKNELAHRIAWVMKHQYMPQNYIKHTCNNTLCVNPDHLIDSGNTGREIVVLWSEIKAKKESGLSTAQIAQELNCDPTTIRRRLKNGR